MGRFRGGGGGGGGQGVLTPPEKTQNIGFLAKLARITQKITKLPSQLSKLGHHRPASETPFRWWPLMAHL